MKKPNQLTTRSRALLDERSLAGVRGGLKSERIGLKSERIGLAADIPLGEEGNS